MPDLWDNIRIKKGPGGCGNVTNEEKNSTISKAVSMWTDMGLSREQISFGIATMGVEAGFNPSTRGTSKSEYGFGQITNDTWKTAVHYYNTTYGGSLVPNQSRTDPHTQIEVMGAWIDKTWEQAERVANNPILKDYDVSQVAYGLWHEGNNQPAALIREYLHDPNGFNNPNIKDYFDSTYETAYYDLIHSTDSPLNDADWNQMMGNTAENDVFSNLSEAADFMNNSDEDRGAWQDTVNVNEGNETLQAHSFQNDSLRNGQNFTDADTAPTEPAAANDTCCLSDDSSPSFANETYRQDPVDTFSADNSSTSEVQDNPSYEVDNEQTRYVDDGATVDTAGDPSYDAYGDRADYADDNANLNTDTYDHNDLYVEQRADPTNDPASFYSEPALDGSVAATDGYDPDNESAMNSAIDSDGRDADDIYASDDDSAYGIQDNLANEVDDEQNYYADDNATGDTADDPTYDAYNCYEDYADDSSIFDADVDDSWT